jgi:DUF971 family protein
MQSPPYRITRGDDALVVEWDRLGPPVTWPARALRLACPCAECVEEMTGRPLLDPARVPDDVRPLALALVGAYGLKITWSDGHSTGIYTWDRLRQWSSP